MHLTHSLISKLAPAPSRRPQTQSKKLALFHDLIVTSQPYTGRDSIAATTPPHNDELLHYNHSKTSFYLCKKFEQGCDFWKMRTCLLKRLAYRQTNKQDAAGRTVFNDAESKNLDQVMTEFHCLRRLQGSHRAVQLLGMLHENTRSKQDMRFFYQFLKLGDRRSKGIRNVCFLLEEMNEGSLKEQIDAIMNKKKQPFTEEKVVQYSCQLAQGLLHLRERGIIHRDLRPENILTHNGQIKFADFDSAFIKNYSNGSNIKNGINMKDTTPLEIMLLVAESQEKLQTLTSEQLYDLQAKADIYFLGVNIYCMVFSQPFESFNGGRILNNLIAIKKRSGYCPKLLDLMASCLEKSAHVRIELDEVVKILGEIEKEFYYYRKNYTNIYLSVEPLNLFSFSSNRIEARIQSENNPQGNELEGSKGEMDNLFWERLKIGTIERHTARYEGMVKEMLKEVQSDNVWLENSRSQLKKEQTLLTSRIESYLSRMQIKAYYFEFVFRVLGEVNLDCVSSLTYRQNIRMHLDLFSNQLIVLLTFLYDMLLKCAFTTDPFYDPNALSYQTRKVFQTVKILYARREFFAGRKRLMKENSDVEELKSKLKEYKEGGNGEEHDREVADLEEAVKLLISSSRKVETLEKEISFFNEIGYDQTEKKHNFWLEHSYLERSLHRMETLVRQQMVHTIISLILAYQKLKIQAWGHRSNLKNAIFMLMILQAQQLDHMTQQDIVIVRDELTRMIQLKLGWKPEELQAFFNNYTEIHKTEVAQGLYELESRAVLGNLPDEAEDICIQINGLGNETPDDPVKENKQQVGQDKTPDEKRAEGVEKKLDIVQVRAETITESQISQIEHVAELVKKKEEPERPDPLRLTADAFDFQLNDSANMASIKNSATSAQRQHLVVQSIPENTPSSEFFH